MKAYLHVTAIVVAVLVVGTGAVYAETQVVVLRNGSVVEGEVVSLGDYYRVTTAATEMRLASRDVERLTSTLIEAYDAKRADIRQPQADDHLRLAAWCIRQELWPQAAREINDARVLEPDHRALTTFEQRLATAARAAERRALPNDPQAAAETSDAEVASMNELANLGAVASSLPAGSLEDFTRHIQPLLVNNCTLAGCHGPTDQRSFKLNRDMLHGIGNRRSTLRNLEATLRAIDPNQVDQSPLLLKAAMAHGTMDVPAFGVHHAKLHARLVEWTYKVTGTEVPQPEPAAGAASGGTAEDPLLDLPSEEGGEVAPQSPASAPPATTPAGRPYFWEVDESGEAIEGELQRGAALQKFTPRDEFDPEIFNRQQQNRGRSPRTAENSRKPAVEVER